MIAQAMLMGMLVAPAHGHAVAIATNLSRTLMITSASAIGCSYTSETCPHVVSLTFPDRPLVVYTAVVTSIQNIQNQSALAFLTVERGEISPVPLATGATIGDVLNVPADCVAAPRLTYVASIGESGLWIRSGIQSPSGLAGCPLLDDTGHLVAIAGGSSSPLEPDPAYVAIRASRDRVESLDDEKLQNDEAWRTANAALAVATARRLSPSAYMQDELRSAAQDAGRAHLPIQPSSLDRTWFNAMPWWCRAAQLGVPLGELHCSLGYAIGEGAPVDVAYALQLAGRAIANGSPEAVAVARSIQTDLLARDDTTLRANEALVASGDPSDPITEAGIGDAYRTGIGARRDAYVAAYWYSRCTATISYCAEQLGAMYLDGDGFANDEQRGVELLQRAGSQCEPEANWPASPTYYRDRCADAYVTLGMYYDNPFEKAYDPAKAIRYYQLVTPRTAFVEQRLEVLAHFVAQPADAAIGHGAKSIAQQIADAQRVFYGPYAPNVALFRQLAASNDPAALYMAGMFFKNAADRHAGAVDDDETAFGYFKRSMDGGDFRAAVAVSAAYVTGSGVSRNQNEARRAARLSIDLALKAAAAKNPAAYLFLGNAYMSGTNVTANCHEAIRWLSLDAATGDSSPDASLALIYTGEAYLEFNGQWIKMDEAACHDLAEGENWLRAGIRAGNTSAAVTLALMLRNGDIGRVDKTEAQRLLQFAADNGDNAAQALLKASSNIPAKAPHP